MLTLTLVSLLVFIVYLALMLRYIGEIPRSLSETYYYLGSKLYPKGGWEVAFSKLKGSIFTVTMWAMAFTLLPAMLNVTPSKWEFLAFFAIAGIVFVGGAPNFKDEAESRTHSISAIISAILGLAWSLIVARGYVPLAASLVFSLAAGFATATLKRSLTFWMELVAFNTVFLSLILLM